MAYTADSLLGLMETELGAVGEALGLLETDALAEAVNEVAAMLGVDSVADVDDDLKLRTIARWQAWLAAEAAAVGGVDLKSDGDEIKLSQRLDGIRIRLARAEAAAARYSEVQDALASSSGVAVLSVVSGMTTAGNPYGWAACNEWSA